MGITERGSELREYTPTRNNIYYLCYLTERISRICRQSKADTVKHFDIPYTLEICLNEDDYHSRGIEVVAREQIKRLGIEESGRFFRLSRNRFSNPTDAELAEIYTDVIFKLNGNPIDNFFRVMNSPIADLIDNYNSDVYLSDTEFLTDSVRAGFLVDEFE